MEEAWEENLVLIVFWPTEEMGDFRELVEYHNMVT